MLMMCVMHEYGLKLGLAFQIMDDAMDYAVTAGSMGKNVGDDFHAKKSPFQLFWRGRMAVTMIALSGSAPSAMANLTTVICHRTVYFKPL